MRGIVRDVRSARLESETGMTKGKRANDTQKDIEKVNLTQLLWVTPERSRNVRGLHKRTLKNPKILQPRCVKIILH